MEYIDWQRKTLLVPLSKSGKPRLISLNPPALALLKTIAPAPGNPLIFPSPSPGAVPFAPLSLVRIRDRAGLKDMRLHDLRHSFASFLVNNGQSLYVVQQLLVIPRSAPRSATPSRPGDAGTGRRVGGECH